MVLVYQKLSHSQASLGVGQQTFFVQCFSEDFVAALFIRGYQVHYQKIVFGIVEHLNGVPVLGGDVHRLYLFHTANLSKVLRKSSGAFGQRLTTHRTLPTGDHRNIQMILRECAGVLVAGEVRQA